MVNDLEKDVAALESRVRAKPLEHRKVSKLPAMRKNEELTDVVELDERTLKKDMGQIFSKTNEFIHKRAKEIRKRRMSKRVKSPTEKASEVLKGVAPKLAKLRVASGLSSKAEDRLTDKRERFDIRTGKVGVNQFIGIEMPPVPEHRKLIIKPPAYFRQGGRRLG